MTPTTGPAQVTKVVPIHLVDNFESSMIRWIPLSVEFAETPKFSLFDAPVTVDKDVPPGGGTQSLKFSYPRKGKRFHGIMRTLDKVDLKKATTLDLAIKCSHDGTFIVTIEEKDGSRYNKKIDLLLGDWKSFSWPLTEFTLAEDSQDENGKLDADQIKQISIGDVTTLLGNGGEADPVNLWLDQVLFVLAP
ncbi:MAG: CIA30 family protein [Planctomycetes bacterium]|nr:CIA30 family protein [Planctomycetota bacterium]